MNKQEFLAEIANLASHFTQEQQKLVQKMVKAFEPFENVYEDGELFAKKAKNKEVDNPTNSFSIGIKERPLSFVRFTLNLDTNEVKKVQSSLAERTVALPELTAPDGTKVIYTPQRFISSNQAIETL